MTAYPVVVYPDAPALVCRYLAAELAARGQQVPCGTRVPSPRPDRFVKVGRVGGPADPYTIDAPILTVEAWATVETAAADLSALCRGLVSALRGSVQQGTPFGRAVELAGPASLPDPDSAQFRYTFTVQLYVRGSAA